MIKINDRVVDYEFDAFSLRRDGDDGEGHELACESYDDAIMEQQSSGGQLLIRHFWVSTPEVVDLDLVEVVT
jgi:hypothetical protein